MSFPSCRWKAFLFFWLNKGPFALKYIGGVVERDEEKWGDIFEMKVIPNQRCLRLPQFSFYKKSAAVFNLFWWYNVGCTGTYTACHSVAYLTCVHMYKPPTTSGCRNAHRVSMNSHVKSPLAFQIALRKCFCTLPNLPLTQVVLKLLLNVKNSTALKFKTNYLRKTTCIFPTSHSLIFLYSG